jgi:adenosylcobinamide kinase/adenosylcobinamide-phosphate guanylyltransferase
MTIPPVNASLDLPPVTLVLGGMRSGKSEYAEQLIERRGGGVYLATATAGDSEMTARIERHQARRTGRWQTVEAPLDLTEALSRATAGGAPVLVDCLTLWLSNLLAAGHDPKAEANRLLHCLGSVTGPVVLVSNEVGQGVVPDNQLARAFVDAAGILNQAVASFADTVVLVTASLPLVLKGKLA